MDSPAWKKKTPSPSELMARLQSLMQSEHDINAEYSEVLQALVHIEEKQASRQREIQYLKQLLMSSIDQREENQMIDRASMSKIHQSSKALSTSTLTLMKGAYPSIPENLSAKLSYAQKVPAPLHNPGLLGSRADLLQLPRKSWCGLEMSSPQTLRSSGTLKATDRARFTSFTVNSNTSSSATIVKKATDQKLVRPFNPIACTKDFTPTKPFVSDRNFKSPVSASAVAHVSSSKIVSKSQTGAALISTLSQKKGNFGGLPKEASTRNLHLANPILSRVKYTRPTHVPDTSDRFARSKSPSDIKLPPKACGAVRVSTDSTSTKELRKTASLLATTLNENASPTPMRSSVLDRLLASAPRLLSRSPERQRERSLHFEFSEPVCNRVGTPRSLVAERSLQVPADGFNNIYERHNSQTGEVCVETAVDLPKLQEWDFPKPVQANSERTLRSKKTVTSLWQSVLQTKKSLDSPMEPTAASPVNRCIASESQMVGKSATPEVNPEVLDHELDVTLKTPAKMSSIHVQGEASSPTNSNSFRGLHQIWEKLTSKYNPEFTEERAQAKPIDVLGFEDISHIQPGSSQDTMIERDLPILLDFQLESSCSDNLPAEKCQTVMATTVTRTDLKVDKHSGGDNPPVTNKACSKTRSQLLARKSGPSRATRQMPSFEIKLSMASSSLVPRNSSAQTKTQAR